MTVKLTDPEKLRVLAAWFDLWDDREDKRGMLLTDVGGSDEVQRDLRRIADMLDEREQDALERSL